MALEDKDVEFGPLKEKWLQQKKSDGMSDGPAKTRLMAEIVNWTQGMLGEMLDENNLDVSKQLCKEKEKDGKAMTNEEIEVCAFIVKGLYNMNSMSKCRKGHINAVMREYVRCAVMSSWIYEYQSTHCGKKHVINNALDVMKIIGSHLSSSGGCEECTYKGLEPMVVNKKPMLGAILELMNTNTKVTQLIRKNQTPKEKCTPEQKKDLPQLVFPDISSSPNMKSTGSSHEQQQQPAPQPKKMSTQQFNFLSKLLPQWIRKYGMKDVENIGEHVWKDMESMFNDLRKRIKTDSHVEMSICADIGKGETPHVTIKKELCKALVRIIYYVSGIKLPENRGQGNPTKEKIKKVDLYLRCLVGKVTMIKLFGEHCRIEDVAQYLVGVIKDKLSTHGAADKYNQCKLVNYEEINIGKKFIGEGIEKWVKIYKEQTGKIPFILSWNNCVNSTNLQQGKGRKGMKGGEHFYSLLGIKGGENELTKLADTTGSLPKASVEEMLKKIKRKKEEKRKQDGCPDSNPTGFEEGEELTISEWFTYFFNEPTDDDEDKYDWSRYSADKAICEDPDEIDVDKYGDFCKIMLKNVMMVTNKKNQYNPKDQNPACKGKHIPLCELLKVWMYYMSTVCAPKKVADYVFRAVDALSQQWGKEIYVKCEYKEAVNLYRENKDMLYEVHKLLQSGISSNKFGLLSKRKWCDESTRQYQTNLMENSTRARSDKGEKISIISHNSEGTGMEDTIKRIMEQMEEEEEELEGIMQVVEQGGGPGVSKAGEAPGKNTPIKNEIQPPDVKFPDENEGFIDGPDPNSNPKNAVDPIEVNKWGSGRIDSVSTGVTPEITPSLPADTTETNPNSAGSVPPTGQLGSSGTGSSPGEKGPQTGEIGQSEIKGPDGGPVPPDADVTHQHAGGGGGIGGKADDSTPPGQGPGNSTITITTSNSLNIITNIHKYYNREKWSKEGG
ncbi:SICA-like antigen [Plasmodium coatneyi]|uniref:SICA-like antigen n=1 Tax=Plasmodium coatneyi TaxID=208452 RepID=A0A1B1DSV4_9APIC|nr:SICA-like antigen [Plasmodium coatneyi]ANQ05871.1 SICA-like antigen [Plasmodium coatneyi]